MSGKLYLVSVGPGTTQLIPPMVREALAASDVIVSYELYLTWVRPWVDGKEIHTPPMTQERARAQLALEKARAGHTVALLSSGDIGIYAMAALAFEDMLETDDFDVQLIPGITSANACASILGSPLSHDFATLSLSDLLCPWTWIEQRARHIAQADLAAVFYNVQSRQRQEGVYRILDIMLEHKRPETLCGIVRNAYREDQTHDIMTLGELRTRQFDMFTTLVIGNRFTRKKRDWIFTPRGYGNWQDTPDTVKAAQLPDNAVWVFAGTSDGNRLAQQLAETGQAVVVSSASEYGAEQAQLSCPNVTTVSGRLGLERRRELMTQAHARAIVDATHPYASEISQQLIELSTQLGLRYLRFERSSQIADFPARRVADMDEAAQLAMRLGGRIFLATGSKDLARFMQAPGAEHKQWFLRMAPDPLQLQRALDLGVPRGHLCAMQGPFSQEANETLWRDWGIDCVVSKESGEAGGYRAKAEAAARMGIPFIVVDRPRIDYPARADSLDAVLAGLDA
ncbi:MAG: precorrin-3B C(17)-methyltransferase [Paludibacterium sp.]|uniref:precorrin-3B C(17)-methyltransferase n=1 Tax=Paludibacterium sp. TaxID=1917523 RepID=UPI0025EBE821|nr:precorrin-3B C(17)-methyltransferase [Paludibacterium sp.]MBV8046995.1 precorrin-3B C(17)-methyltransferase [Paludibacterium sp.]MBV8649067.1 precorrin-3B C(17)-methyltransferase [Paludibacterium sp.]